MPPLTPEFIATLIALTVGTAFGIYMAARRPAQLYDSVVQLAAIDNLYGDQMPEPDENLYVQDVLPLQMEAQGELVAKLRAVARDLARDGKEVTADELHERCPIPPGVDPRIMGAAFFPRKDWMKVGYRPSVRRENHNRPIARWILKEGKA